MAVSGATQRSFAPPLLRARSRLQAAVLRFPGASAFLAFLLMATATRAGEWRRLPGYDAGQYLYVGQVILDGGTPYVDAANNKGPALFLLFALIRLLAGTSSLLVWLTALLFTALAALALAGWLASHAGPWPSFLGGLLFAGIGMPPVAETAGIHAEHYGLAPMLGALWLATRGTRLATALAGALSAVAILMSPWFGIVVPFVALEIWRSAGSKALGRSLGVALVGGALVAAPLLGWIVAAGALDEMEDQLLGQVGTVLGVADPDGAGASGERGALEDGAGARADEIVEADRDAGAPEGGEGLTAFLDAPDAALTLVALVGVLLALRAPALRGPALGAVAWGALVWARGLVSYSFEFHYALALPAVATAIALGLASLWRGRLLDTRLGLAGAVVLALLAYPAVRFDYGAWSLAAGTGPERSYVEEISEFVRSHTEEDDEVIATVPYVYWLSDRRAASRFFDLYELIGNPENLEERRAELLREPPRAIALLTVNDDPLTGMLEPLVERRGYQLAVVGGNWVFVRPGGQ